MTHDCWVTPSSTRRRAIPVSPPSIIAEIRARSTGCRSSQETQEEQAEPAAGVTAGSCVASSAGGRGYLARPRPGMAARQCRPRQPRPVEGDVVRSRAAARRRSAAMSRAARTRPAPTPISPTTAAATGTARSARALRPSEWLAAREADLLPVPYFHVVFTLPAPIADIAYQNKAVIYDLLFKASAETTLTIAADPKHLGARIGFISVLHTWGSALTHHPHVHMIVPGGGLSPDGSKLDRVPTTLFFARAGALARCSAGCFWRCWSRPTTPAACSSSASMRGSPIRRHSLPIWRRCARSIAE